MDSDSIIDATSKFEIACVNNDIELAKQILCENPTIDVGADDNLLFRVACHNGHLELVQWLSTVSAMTLDKLMVGTIWEICEHGHIGILQWLAEIWHDVDIHRLDDYSFYIACKHGHFELVKWMLRRWPDINVAADQNHPLRTSCRKNHREIVEYLIGYMISNGRDVSDVFVILCRCTDDVELVKWFMNTYPDVDFYTDTKNSPFEAALCCVNLDVAYFLYETNGRKYPKRINYIDGTFEDICETGKIKYIDWFLTLYPDAKSKRNMMSVLIRASTKNDIALIQHLSKLLVESCVDSLIDATFKNIAADNIARQIFVENLINVDITALSLNSRYRDDFLQIASNLNSPIKSATKL